MNHRIVSRLVRVAVVPIFLAVMLPVTTRGQDRLKTMPGYQQYAKVSQEIPGAVKLGSLAVTWNADSGSFEYTHDGKRVRYDVATRTATEIGAAPDAAGGRGRGGRGGAPGIERGRQAESADTPDGKMKAFYRARNLWVSARGWQQRSAGHDRRQRNRADQVRHRELGLRRGARPAHAPCGGRPTAASSPTTASTRKRSPTTTCSSNRRELQSEDDAEAYPKAGVPNPIVDLFVYDVASKKIDQDRRTQRQAVRQQRRRPLRLSHRRGRRTAASCSSIAPTAGRTSSSSPPPIPTPARLARSSARNGRPGGSRTARRCTFLKDGRRFIWESERNGWSNLYLYDLTGKLIAPLTAHTTFEVGSLLKIDEAAGVVFYTARDGDNYMKMQLHRVGLDGKGDVRLTDPAFNHTIGGCMGPGGGGGGRGGFGGLGGACGISPDNKYFVDVYQTHDMPPATRLVDATTGRSSPSSRRAISPSTPSSASRRRRCSPTTPPTARRRSTG